MINSDSDYSYCVSGRQAMALAVTGWYSFSTDEVFTQYVAEPVEVENEPDWHGSYIEMLEEAIIDMMIDSEDHEVVQNLVQYGRRSSSRRLPMPVKKASSTPAVKQPLPKAPDPIDPLVEECDA